MSPVIVATGFNREAAIVAGPGIVTVAGGGDQQGLHHKLEAAVGRGACGIVSYGLTGGLADGLAIGDWVVGDRIAGAIDLPTDPRWRDALAARLPGARIGGFFANGRMIDTVAEKRALGVKHDALAVDMESHIAAQVAAHHGLPFAIVRIVSDEVGHLLPHAITVSMRPNGGIDTAAMLKSLAARPGQMVDVARTMRLFARGFAGLRKGVRRIGPRMAFPS